MLLNDLEVLHARYVVLWLVGVASDALWALETIGVPLESLGLDELVLLNQNLIINALGELNVLLDLIKSHLHVLVVNLLPLLTLGSQYLSIKLCPNPTLFHRVFNPLRVVATIDVVKELLLLNFCVSFSDTF